MELPEDIVNHIVCLAIKMKEPHPFAEEIRTLNMIHRVVRTYRIFYGQVEALDWLAIDLDTDYPFLDGNAGIFIKWRKLTPQQRHDFVIKISA